MAIDISDFYQFPRTTSEQGAVHCRSVNYWVGRVGLVTTEISEAIECEAMSAGGDLWLPGARFVVARFARVHGDYPVDRENFRIDVATVAAATIVARMLHRKFSGVIESAATNLHMEKASLEDLQALKNLGGSLELKDIAYLDIQRPG